MIYLVLAIIILYIISLRLALGVKVYVNTDTNIGAITVTFFFVPIFRKKVNVKRLLRGKEIIQSDEKTKKPEKSGKPSKLKKFLKDCAIGILKAVCINTAHLQARIGTGDAAADGMAVGLLRIMYAQASAFFGFDGDGEIEPDYNSEILFFDFFGIFSISFADIIFAVCCVIFDKLSHVGGRRSYANATE